MTMNELKDPEILARILYEAQPPLLAWSDLPEPMKETPLMQARKVMEMFHIIPREEAGT